MGVAGLWDILRPAGETRSLTHLAVVNGFEANPDGVRGFRVGIDASIWFYHAMHGREGENPELRTLFFKCAKLMRAPFLPLFVFDGPNRPNVKRGKRITRRPHWMIQGMQKIIDAFGYEWRVAPGEAEAELAYLNRAGVIDAVYTDDVDTFLFGAKMVVRNASPTLSGNHAHSLKNSAGHEDGNHVATYTAHNLLQHPSVQLTQGGLILIGILCGGDYHQAGLIGCGTVIAHGLAKCGFGDTLLEAARTLRRADLPRFLHSWREELRAELRTNSHGHVGRKHVSLAKSIPDNFPDIDVLLGYTNPITTEAKGSKSRNLSLDWGKEPDLGKIAALCELYFEWGVKELIIQRFRTILWPAAVLRILRRATLISDQMAAGINPSPTSAPTTPSRKRQRQRVPGTPSSMITHHFSSMRLNPPKRGSSFHSILEEDDGEEPLIVKIHSARTHASTDGVLEYRLEIAPAQLVSLCELGVEGLREKVAKGFNGSDEDDRNRSIKAAKKLAQSPRSHLRIWLPACMVRIAEPVLAEEFESFQKTHQAKQATKAMQLMTSGITVTKETGARKDASVPTNQDEDEGVSFSLKPNTMSISKKRMHRSTQIDQPNRTGDLGGLSIIDFLAIGKDLGLDKETTQTGSRSAKISVPLTDHSLSFPDEMSDVPDQGFSISLNSHRSSQVPPLSMSSRASSSASGSSSTHKGGAKRSTFDAQLEPLLSRPEPMKPRFVSAPFPMSFEDFVISPCTNDPPDIKPSQQSQLPVLLPRTRQRSLVSSNSDEDNTLQKSPRKSKNESSPRSKGQRSKKNEDMSRRTSSPTPVRSRGHPRTLNFRPLSSPSKWKFDTASWNNPAIVILSDSDSDYHTEPMRIAPLLPMQAMGTGITSSQTQHSAPARRTDFKKIVQTEVISEDKTNASLSDSHHIIDLT